MMMLAKHFVPPRVSYQEPCKGTGLVVDIEPTKDHQHADCPTCKQSIVLTTITPSMRRGGVWESPNGSR